MYIYADVVLLVNIVMNSIILVLTGWAAGCNFKIWRIIAAAFLGGIYALGEVTGEFVLLYTPLVKLIASVAILFIAFGKRRWRSLIISLAWFYIMSILAGGAVFGWLIFTNSSSALPGNNQGWLSVTWYHLAAGVVLVVMLFLVALRRMRTDITQRQLIFPVTVYYEDRQVSLSALLDTGNRLFSASGQTPVILVDFESITEVLNEKVKNYLRERPSSQWLVELGQCGDPAWLARIQCVPYRAVGCSSILLAFKPDRVMVINKDRVIETQSVVIGIYSGSLSAGDKYNALLHPRVLECGSDQEGANACA
ncbi:MAG: sporulation factor SpoIIGA [Firmicutes bacterium]|nr:sporulation factor SpoIIGA [Bacillota bacterium]